MAVNMRGIHPRLTSYIPLDLNEAEIVASGGLQPVVAAAAEAADFISPTGSKASSAARTPKMVEQHEELGAQSAR